ncbi:MAG: class I SAM-dependent methyltransferase [Candidatus ainarchaeum sp.]|nr:class I SAM-dependent methyltransferase [Candidatus ainarchaeum sp.]
MANTHRIQLVAPLPRIITGTNSGYQKKLNKPPSEETIMRASAAFSEYYDEWMAGHHAIAAGMLRQYHDSGYIGRVVTEVGCGTAVLTSRLILERQREILDELGKNGELSKPLTFICLDFSAQMLLLAKANIAETLGDLIGDLDMQPVRLSRGDFSISPGGNSEQGLQQLLYRGKPVINVRFECKDASRLKEVEDGDKTDTLILSYVMHWFRGLERKLGTLQELHAVLPPGGRVISIEEYPLVVRCDLHPGDQKIQELGGMIEEATTVVPRPHIRELFIKAGFAAQDEVAPDSAIDERIDDYHVMYGNVYGKER